MKGKKILDSGTFLYLLSNDAVTELMKSVQLPESHTGDEWWPMEPINESVRNALGGKVRVIYSREFYFFAMPEGSKKPIMISKRLIDIKRTKELFE